MMNEGAQPEPFVDADAVAAFLSIKRRQVLELARSGRIPAHPLLGSRRKVWRFRLSEVDAAVVSGIRQPPISSNHEALAEAIPPLRMPCASPGSQKGKL
jgi:excisionase family DNA binding protein